MPKGIYQRKNAAKTFEGEPCNKCGNTIRFVTEKRCIKCRRSDENRENGRLRMQVWTQKTRKR